jgi:hypothetical protein
VGRATPEALPETPDLDVPRVSPAPVVVSVEASAPRLPAPPPVRRPHRGLKVDPSQLSVFDPSKK